MIRVLYDHEYFSVYEYSGITRYFQEIIRRISSSPDFRASLFMGFHTNRFNLEKEMPDLERFFGMQRLRIPKSSRFFNYLNSKLFPVFGALSKSDLLHQTYYAKDYPGFKGKRIFSVYDMTYELMPEMFPKNLKEAREKAEAVALADGIISISESTTRDLIDILKVPKEKIRTIYLGNSLTIDPGETSIIGEPYILFVGNRKLYKNFATVLKAYGNSPAIHSETALVCFGGGPFSQEENQAIQDLGIATRVRQLSGPDSKLANLYRFSQAFVSASLNEGFGLPVVEAMGYGCPVVLSRSSSFPEVAGDAGIYFNPKDSEELAHELKRILEGQSHRNDKAGLALRQAQKFTWDRCAQQTMDYYRQVCGV